MNFTSLPGVAPDNRAKIVELLQINKNGACADCGMTLTVETAWAVLSYGIFVCDDCKLVHIQQENHCKSLDQGNNAESSVTGILPASYYLRWEDKDWEQMRINGNEKVNQKLLSNVPPWQYKPLASDGIKHKEYWIKCKYGKGVGANKEISKTASKSFIGIQFSRPMSKGISLPCCAVLQSDKLYLTSDVKNEEIRIEDIETILINSKRIGKDNGVQLTYRTSTMNDSNQQNGVTNTYLQHENMETVIDWIDLILYTKFNLLQEKYPSYSKDDIAKMLNCFMVKESYMPTSSYGLIYVSLSEGRIACFRHHLDEKPLFHLTIAQALKMTGSQYLEAMAQFFSIDVCNIHGYDDWNSCLEHALQLDKLAYLADDLLQPANSQESLPTKKASDNLPQEQSAEKTRKVTSVDEKREVNNVSDVAKLPENLVPPLVPLSEKSEEKPMKKYECYPPIGPMGEMGKVARGELPPDAIKVPSKIDPSRVQIFGMTNPMNPGVSTSSIGHSNFAMPHMSSMNMTQPSSQSTNVDCYPPISGPVRDMTDVFHPMPRLPSAGDDMYPVIDEFKPMNNSFRVQDRRGRMQMPQMSYETDVGHLGRAGGSNGFRSPTDPHYSLTRSTSWNPTTTGRSMEWQMKQDYFNHAVPKPVPYRSGTQEQVIMDNLQQQWTSAERKLLALIHNGYVPASNMSAAGLDANSLDHAQTCISELFDLLWKKRYDLALSFVRGFREVFSRSTLAEIRNQFIGVGELDTMKQIFLHQGREKFLKSGGRGVVTWKQPNEPSTHDTWTGASQSFGEACLTSKGSLQNTFGEPCLTSKGSLQNTFGEPCLTSKGSLQNNFGEPCLTSKGSLQNNFAREFSSDYSPWGLTEIPQANMPSKLWGSTPSTHASGPPFQPDPWNTARGIGAAAAQPPHIGVNGNRPFNRAPSRPISLTRSSFSETSPTDGSFDSKTSSDSTSPEVITPPASLDAILPATALTGIETTLNNLFLNSCSGGSTLWN